MGFFIALLVLGVAAYVFLKTNTKRGAETVRAHVFLGGLHSGATVDEANYAANFDIANGRTEIIQSAIDHLKERYRGKQLTMITEAYRQGMQPRLPLWYQVIADICAGNMPSRNSNPTDGAHNPITPQDQAQDWVRLFVLYYVASEMRWSERVGKIPETVRSLALGKPSGATQQSLLVALRNYLSYAYGRQSANDDLRQAVIEARNFLQAELRTGNSLVALRRLVRRMHTENGQSTISQDELDGIVAGMIAEMKSSDEFADKVRTMILKDGTEQLFEAKHGKSFDAYQQHMLEYAAKNGI